jgi:hypothetical protein
MAGPDDERAHRRATTDRRTIREGEGEPSRSHKRSDDDISFKNVWVFHKTVGLVTHHPEAQCGVCREYSMHRALEAFSLNASLETAIADHTKAVSERYIRERDEAESRLRRYRHECDDDRREIEDLRARLNRAYDDIDDLNERLKEAEGEPLTLQSGKRKRSRPASKATSSEVNTTGDDSVAMQADPPRDRDSSGDEYATVDTPDLAMSDLTITPQPAGNPTAGQSPALSQPTAAQVVSGQYEHQFPGLPTPGIDPQPARVPHHFPSGERSTGWPRVPGFSAHHSTMDNTIRFGGAAHSARRNENLGLVPPRGKMAMDDRGIPTTEKQWIRLVRNCGTPGNMGAIRKAQFTVTQARTTPAELRTDVQRMAIREWRYPEWVPAEARHITRPPNTQPRPTGGTRQPDMDSSPEEWALWLAAHPTSCPPGIVMKWDGTLSLRELRGLILIGRLSPPKNKKPKGSKGDAAEPTSERQRSAYKLTAAGLFGVPGQYAALIESMGCTIVDREGSQSRYTGSFHNLTVNDLTKFYASQGVTLQEADDLYAFASNWLDAAVMHRPADADTIQSLREAAALQVRARGQPPSLTPGKDEWHPPDYFIPRTATSTATTSNQPVATSSSTAEGPLASTPSFGTSFTDALWAASLPKGRGKKSTTTLAGAGPSHQMTLAKATGSKHPDPSVVPRNSGTMAEQTVPASDPCNSGPLYFPSTLPIEGGNNTEDDDDRQRSSTANPLPGNTSDEEGAIDENPPSKAEDSVMNDAETSA